MQLSRGIFPILALRSLWALVFRRPCAPDAFSWDNLMNFLWALRWCFHDGGKCFTAVKCKTSQKGIQQNILESSRTMKANPFVSAPKPANEQRKQAELQYEMCFIKQVLTVGKPDENKIKIFSSGKTFYLPTKTKEKELRLNNLRPSAQHSSESMLVWNSFLAAGPGCGYWPICMYTYIKKMAGISTMTQSTKPTKCDPGCCKTSPTSWKHHFGSSHINPIENLWDYFSKTVQEQSVSSKAV